MGPLVKATVLTAALLIAFGLGLPRDMSALVVAAAVFVSRSIESQALVRSVDWGLLILFGGLFIVTGALADLPEAGILFSDLIAAGWAPGAAPAPRPRSRTAAVDYWGGRGILHLRAEVAELADALG